MEDNTQKNERIVSGARPTGRLHLGNYWGTIRNWVDLQDKYDCYFFVADWHALTTGAEEKSAKIADNTRDMVLDLMAVGLDMEKCVFFRQSDVKAHAELNLLLSIIMPINQLLRNPTFKDQLREFYNQKYKGQEASKKEAEGVIRQLADAAGGEAQALQSDMAVLGFLGYPVLMAADIMIYDAKYVPIGRDQLPHLEITRELVRRFNKTFKAKVFSEPQPLFTKTAIVPGLDGRKMSKSYDNTISICEESKSLEKKIKKMFTDPKKIKADDPGHPEGCVVCAFHRLYNEAGAPQIEQQCLAGQRGCGNCKKELIAIMEAAIGKVRERRAELEKTVDIDRILEEGAKKASVIANAKVRQASKAAGII